MTACPSCATELQDHAKFCFECGTAVSGPATSAEYKQVTVLFADMVHSMSIAAAVGTERLRELMGELFDRSATVVKRYGGTVDKFTGDGIMSVFGAPIALEDHALRACLAALEIQAETVKVPTSDGIVLQLRIGLNSGQVIAGEIGSGTGSYTAIGEQVGMAQRMESVAPAGAVMLSESTARLVDDAAVLGERELLRIKGSDQPVPARCLLAISNHQPGRRSEAGLVGRTCELNTATAVLEEAIGGAGCVLTIVAPPGIGKSRLVRETVASMAGRGVPVFTTYCESHTTDIAFHVVAGLIRATSGIDGLEADRARARVRARLPNGDTEDLLLIDDLLGIGDPPQSHPSLDPMAAEGALRQWSTQAPSTAERPLCSSSRTHTGSTRPVNPCWPISWRSFRRRRRWC